MNNGNLANSAGLVSFNILNVNALYIEGVLFDGDTANLQAEIDAINATLTNTILPITNRIDLTALTGNLIITETNKNSVLLTAITNINTQIAGFNKFDLTGLTGVGSCVITNATTNQALNSLITTNTSNIATNTSNISTNTSNIATNTTNIATNTSAIASINSQISSINTSIGAINAKLAHFATWSWGSNTFSGIKDGTGFAVALGSGSQYDDNGVYVYQNDSDQTAQIRIQTQNAKQLYMSGGSAVLIYAGSNGTIINRNLVRVGAEADHIQIGTLSDATKYPLISIGTPLLSLLPSRTNMGGDWYFGSTPPSIYDCMIKADGVLGINYEKLSTTTKPFLEGLNVVAPLGLINLSALVGGITLNAGAGILALNCGLGSISLSAGGGSISANTGGGALSLNSGAGVMNFASSTSNINTTTLNADIYLGAGKGAGGSAGSINLRAVGTISISPDTNTEIDKASYVEMKDGSAPATTTRKLYHSGGELNYSGTKLSNQTSGFNVKELTAGSNITLSSTSGNYTINATNQTSGFNVKELTAGSNITITSSAGNYTINSTGGGSGGGSGGGTTFILLNTTSVVNTSPMNTMTSVYSSTALTTITRNAYTANTTYAMGEFKSTYINGSANLILSGSYTADLFGLLTSNQPSYLYSKLYHIAERATPSTQFVVDKSLIYTSGSNTNNYQLLSTKPLPVPVNETSITLYQVVIPQLRTISSPNGSELITLTLSLVNNAGTTLYTFPTQNATIGDQTADRTFQVSGGNTTIDAFTLTSFYFKLVITDDFMQGSVMRQALMRSDTDIVYKLGASIKTLIYNGTTNKTTLTNGVSTIYQLEMPFSFNSYDISDYTDYSKIQLEPFFIQPSGSTGGHSFVLRFQDGALSHLSTSISSVGASTLAQVLSAGNTANTSINMNSNNITNVGTIAPTAITGWNVKSISGGSGISVAQASGTYTISATTSPNDSEPAMLISYACALPSKPFWYNTIYSWLYNTSNLQTGENYLDNCVSNTGQYQLIISSNKIRYSVDWGVSWGNTNLSSFLLNGVCITGSGNRYYINGSTRVFYFDATYSSFGSSANYLTSFPTLSGSLSYTRMKCSQDGKYILIGGGGGYATIYQSSDYGFTSTQQNTQGALINIDDVAMSSDGKYQFLMFRQTGGIAGRVMYSTNYGVSFSSPTMPAYLSNTLLRVACSATGQYVITINQGIGVLFSTDYGKNYTYSAGSVGVPLDCCMSANGQFALVVDNNGVWFSEDYGRSFLTYSGTLTGAIPALQTIACSATGGYACVAGDAGKTWVIYDTPTDVRQLTAGTNITISPNGFGTYTINSTGGSTPSYVLVNEYISVYPNIDGYVSNGWRSVNTITWDFDNFEYDIQFDLQIGSGGYYPTNIFWSWNGDLNVYGQYHHSWCDHDGINYSFFGAGQDTDNRVIYTYGTANTHHNFNMTLKRVQNPKTNYYQRLLLECNCNQIVIGAGTSNISSARMPFSRTNNYYFADGGGTTNLFNGAKTLTFYGRLSNCSASSSGNGAWLRITKRPIT